jgi:hypothetical protein
MERKDIDLDRGVILLIINDLAGFTVDPWRWAWAHGGHMPRVDAACDLPSKDWPHALVGPALPADNPQPEPDAPQGGIATVRHVLNYLGDPRGGRHRDISLTAASIAPSFARGRGSVSVKILAAWT